PSKVSLQRGVAAQPWALKAPLILIVIGCLIGAYFLSSALFTELARAELFAELLIRKLITLSLNALFFMLCFSGLVSAFSTHLLNPALELILTAPQPLSRVYLARLIELWVQSAWVLFLFGLPLLFAAGPALSAPPSYYCLTLILLTLLTMLGAGISAAVAIALARFLPAQRLQELLILLLVGSFLYLYARFHAAEPSRFLSTGAFASLIEWSRGLGEVATTPTPVYWGVEALFAFLRWDLSLAASAGARLIGASLLVAGLSVALAGNPYRRAYQRSREGSRQRSQRVKKIAYPAPLWVAISLRELRLFIRDPAQWTQLLLVASLSIVYIYNFTYFKALHQGGFFSDRVIFYMHLGISGLISATLCARFVYPLISQEGRAFWQLRAAPLSLEALFYGKACFALFPLSLLSLSLGLFSSLLLKLSPSWAALLISSSLASSLVLTSLALMMGAVNPRFDLPNPAQLASGLGGIVYMLLALLALTLIGLGLAWPISLLERAAEGAHAQVIIPTALILLGGSFFLFRALTRWAARRLDALEF
ncbi:MAG: hypothetical protein VYD19_04135, partial [Myxococcota bacterium]|nr:hypothetical protein [Myxococcota bacterium]